MYGIMLRLPILALNLTQDGSNGQHNGTDLWELIDAAVVRYEPATSGNQRQGGAGSRGEESGFGLRQMTGDLCVELVGGQFSPDNENNESHYTGGDRR